MSSVKKLLFGYAIPICLLCLTYNVPKFFELTVEYSACDSMTKEKNMTLGQGYDSEEYFFEMDCEDGVRAELIVRKYLMTNGILSNKFIPFLAYSSEDE